MSVLFCDSVPRFLSVRMEGLEPPRLSAPDPKSGTATNYATCAFPIKRDANIWLNFEGLFVLN